MPLFDPISNAYGGGMSVYEPDVSIDVLDKIHKGMLFFQVDDSGIMVRDNVGILSIHDDFKSASLELLKLKYKH